MNTSADIQHRVLYAVRLLGYAGTQDVSERAGLAMDPVEAGLLEAQSSGHIAWSQFADDGGWSLTEDGKLYGEKLLAAELERSAARPLVESVMEAFEPLNPLVTQACTRWQLTEMKIAAVPASLGDVLAELADAAGQWAALEQRLLQALPRFGGYHTRFCHAIERARTDPAWVTSLEYDSAHRVWFELHEDLLATLGRGR